MCQSWVGPQQGHCPLTSKIDGLSLMMSAIQSGEIDFAVHVSCIQLEEMSFQLRDQNFVDTGASIPVRGQAGMMYLTDSPFVVSLNWGHQTIRDFGLTIACVSNLRNVLAVSRHSYRNFTSWFCSITHRDILKVNKWIGCLSYE